MTLKQAIKWFGSASDVADALGIKPQNISQWRDNGWVPYGRQLQLEDITDGELKANPKDKKRPGRAFK